MSYIKIGELGFKFNELAVRKFSEILLQDMANGLSEADLATSSVYAMIWGGLYGNSYVKREPMPYTFEQVCELTEKLTSEELKSISDVFTDVQAYKDLLAKLQPVEGEKKKNQKQKVR